MRAAEQGRVESAKALWAAGANANATVTNRDSIRSGCNALIFAAKSGNAELVELLIGAGASPNCRAADAATPLSLAVEHGSVRMVQALLQAGAPLPTDILLASVWKNFSQITLLLVQFGANVNVCDDLGQCVLHRAAEKGQLETVRALIQAKAKLNQKANRSTPLLVAIQNGHSECALELIRAGADLSITDVFQRDALMSAAYLGQRGVVLALLKAGANKDARDNEDKTALMLANEKEHADIVRSLREARSDEAGYDVQEYIRAAIKGDVKRVRDFLKAGMDVNATYQNGAKALICAIQHGQTEVVRLLIDWGVDVSTDAGARLGDIPLETDALAVAADKGHLEIVRLLLKAGANVNKSRMVNMNVLTVAAREGHTDVLRELLNAGYSSKKGGALDALARQSGPRRKMPRSC